MLWHFVWGVGLAPVLSPRHYGRISGHTVYAGSFLKSSDFQPLQSQAARQKNAFGVFGGAEAAPRPALEKIDGGAPKPEALLADTRAPASAKISSQVFERPVPQQGVSGDEVLAFGMADYGRYLYQADFSDLRRAVGRQALSRVIVFEIFLDNDGRVKQIKKISGSGDPSLDLFIQSKIDNAVFKSDEAPRGRWFTVRFSLR